jgi:hypothetical protein
MSALKHPKRDGHNEQREGLTIERYAEVMAYRRHFPAARATEVLLRLGVQPAQWEAATRAWGEAMASALKRDEPDPIARFAQALSVMARRLREFPPRLEALGEPVALELARPTGPRTALPSYLHEDAFRAPEPEPVVARAPLLAAAAQPLGAAGHEPRPHAAHTAEMSAFIPRHLLPFKNTPGEAPEPPSAAAGQAPGAPPRPAAATEVLPLTALPLVARFDPMTGAPLPPEAWRVVNPEPERKG